MGRNLRRLGGHSTSFYCRTHLAPSNAGLMHKVGRATPHKEGHWKNRGRSREGPDLPTTRMPGRYCYRQRPPVHEPRVRRPPQGMARQAQADSDVYTSVLPRGADQPGIKTMIAQSIAKNQKTWDRNVPELAFAYNSASTDPPVTHPPIWTTGEN